MRGKEAASSPFPPPGLPNCCQPVGRLPVVALVYFQFCLLFSDGSGGSVSAAYFSCKVR